MNCGKELASMWRYYQSEVSRIRTQKGLGAEPIYIDGTKEPDMTPERMVLDTLGITRYCCRKHLLTHCDLIEKI